MSQTLAVDEAWSKIPPAQLRAAGYAGAFLYLSHDDGKSAHPPDVQALHGEGRGIGLVFEDEAARWRGGHSQGVADGVFANRAANLLGHPVTLPLYCAIDQDVVTEQDFLLALDYVRGFDSAGPRRGRGYGEYDLIERLFAGGLGDGWQTCAWSGSKVSSHAAIYQRLKPTTGMTGSFDEDVLLDPTGAGLWYPAASTPDTRRYRMLVFAQDLDAVTALAVCATRRAGVATTDVAEAKAAIARGDKVVVIGGPAAKALGLTAPVGQPTTTGATTVAIGQTASDTLGLACQLIH